MQRHHVLVFFYIGEQIFVGFLSSIRILMIGLKISKKCETAVIMLKNKDFHVILLNEQLYSWWIIQKGKTLMAVTYKKLWHILLDRDMKKKDLLEKQRKKKESFIFLSTFLQQLNLVAKKVMLSAQ